MRLISFECEDEEREKWLVDAVEEYIAKADKCATVDVNYFVTE